MLNKKEYILSKWMNNELLSLDCILKFTGEVILLNNYTITDNGNTQYYSKPFCETSIESLEKYNKEIWTPVEVFTDKVQDTMGRLYYAGEGGMGNEGFVVCTDEFDNFQWAMFSKVSNPFYKIEIENNSLNVFSSYDLKYQIDIYYPELITIHKSYWREK